MFHNLLGHVCLSCEATPPVTEGSLVGKEIAKLGGIWARTCSFVKSRFAKKLSHKTPLPYRIQTSSDVDAIAVLIRIGGDDCTEKLEKLHKLALTEGCRDKKIGKSLVFNQIGGEVGVGDIFRLFIQTLNNA